VNGEHRWQLMRPCVRGRDLKSLQLSVAGNGSCRLFARRPLVGSGYLLLLIPVGRATHWEPVLLLLPVLAGDYPPEGVTLGLAKE
jgi:hypothetical protein